LYAAPCRAVNERGGGSHVPGLDAQAAEGLPHLADPVHAEVGPVDPSDDVASVASLTSRADGGRVLAA